VDRGLQAGDVIKVGRSVELECLDTPGHTLSHVCLLAHGAGGLSIALVDLSKCQIEAGLNLAGDGNDTVTFNNVQPAAIKPAPKGFDQTSLMLMGAVARSLQIAGTLESMLDISVRYSNERVAFEKKISKFQAVQHNLARLAGETAAAMTAASSAADTIANAGEFDDAVFLEATAAKIRCAEAADPTGVHFKLVAPNAAMPARES